MKIALVGPAHPYKGGGARHTTELAHRLTAAGHDVIISSWRAQYPRRLYPGQQTIDVPEGRPFPRTGRRLRWYRPDGWLAEGRRLASADLVIFALLTPLQVPAYLTILTALRRGPALTVLTGLRRGTALAALRRRPAHLSRTAVICHNVLPHERRPGDVTLTRTLLRQVDTVLVHSAGQAALARELAPAALIVTTQLPPHLPAAAPDHSRLFAERPLLPPPGNRLLFFGIVRPYKGLDVLLHALAQARASSR